MPTLFSLLHSVVNIPEPHKRAGEHVIIQVVNRMYPHHVQGRVAPRHMYLYAHRSTTTSRLQLFERSLVRFHLHTL